MCVFISEWDREVARTEGTKKEASLMKVVIRTFGFKYALLGIFAILTVSITTPLISNIENNIIMYILC